MSSFIIECPACKNPIQAGTGPFAKKSIKCSCGYLIDVSAERFAKTTCIHCGNTVVYDRSKSDSAVCPTCNNRINVGTELVKITCPSCKIELNTDKNAKTYKCPQCKTVIDVQARIIQQQNFGKTSIVKWDMGLNDIFVYRHPIENFSIGSQLIVTEGQKALFFRNGKGLDVFGPGRHILETQKLPLLEEILKLPTNADVTFDSKVYFIRTNRLNVKWGVPEIRLRNPEMDFYINIGISGSMDMQVIDDNESVRKFVYMIIDAATGGEFDEPMGSGQSYTTEYIQDKFRDVVTTRLSDLITNIIIENKINVLDIESKKIVISDILCNDFNNILEEYGLVIPKNHFNLTKIVIHNNEDVERWQKQEAERSIRTREEKLEEDVIRSSQGRIRAEEEAFALRGSLHTQAEADIGKIAASGRQDIKIIDTETEAKTHVISTQGDVEAGKIAASGRQEIKLTDTETEAKSHILSTQGDVEAGKIAASGRQEIKLTDTETERQSHILSTKGDVEAENIAAVGRQQVRLTDTQTEAISTRISALGEADAMRIRAQAEGDVESLRAPGKAEAMVTLARAEGESSKERAIGDSEAIRLRGIGAAEAYRAQAYAEADEMKAKDYSYDQETRREVSLEALKNGLPGTGNNRSGGSGGAGAISNTIGNMMGIGLELGAMSSIMGVTKDILSPTLESSVELGKKVGGVIGGPKGQTWNCSCGKTNITSNFCPDCGCPKPSPQPQSVNNWDCTCGCKNISSRFCPDCGSLCPLIQTTWDCPNCWRKNITTRFCPDCGFKKGE